MSDDIDVTGTLKEEILGSIAALGPGDDLSGGMRRLDERTYSEIDQLKVEIRANEGQHRGRPHCCVTTDKGAVSVDILTGEIIEGDAGKWNTPIKKVVKSHSNGLKKLWDEMRPDDQKLPQASTSKT